jgi:hypothetical protein
MTLIRTALSTMANVIYAECTFASVTPKPFMGSVVMLNVVMTNIVALMVKPIWNTVLWKNKDNF